jgi:hypothetical protein
VTAVIRRPLVRRRRRRQQCAAVPADAAVIGDADAASIWYRHGWQGRMRLQRRPPDCALTWSAAGMLALGVVSLVAGWVLYFARG